MMTLTLRTLSPERIRRMKKKSENKNVKKNGKTEKKIRNGINPYLFNS